MSIGKRLIQLRGEKTQQEVAENVGITVSALSMYENDNRIPRDEVKVKLSKYYNVGIEDLFFAREVHEM
jgi:transcriptional regulator with XRE-family HTH domain